MIRRRNSTEPPKSPEARRYLRELESGQITPAAVERRIATVREAIDDARYFGEDAAVIEKLEAGLRELEAVLVWDQAASVERGLAAAAEKPAARAAEKLTVLPVSAGKTEDVFDVPAKTHDGFPLGPGDRREIANLLRMARDGLISRTSITEARNEVEDRIRTERDREKLQELRQRFVILDEVVHLAKFKLKNRRRNGDEDLRRLERKARAGDAAAFERIERLALGRAPGLRALWLELLAGTGRSALRDEIVDAMARALFVSAWADSEEEAGRPRELMDEAPETIPQAIEVAQDLAREIEERNQKALDVMYEEAAAVEGRHYKDPTPGDFGHYTAMQSLGHGVSWADDHPYHGFDIPLTDFTLVPADYGEDEPEICAGCGAELEQPGERGFDPESDYCRSCRAARR